MIVEGKERNGRGQTYYFFSNTISEVWRRRDSKRKRKRKRKSKRRTIVQGHSAAQAQDQWIIESGGGGDN